MQYDGQQQYTDPNQGQSNPFDPFDTLRNPNAAQEENAQASNQQQYGAPGQNAPGQSMDQRMNTNPDVSGRRADDLSLIYGGQPLPDPQVNPAPGISGGMADRRADDLSSIYGGQPSPDPQMGAGNPSVRPSGNRDNPNAGYNRPDQSTRSNKDRDKTPGGIDDIIGSSGSQQPRDPYQADR